MAGIKISLIDDVKSFLTGMSRSEDALDDVADSLDDLARDAQKASRAAGDDLGKNIDRGAGKAEDAVEGMERSFRDLADGVKRESRKAGDSIEDNLGEGAERGRRKVQDNQIEQEDIFRGALKAEIVSNMAESGAEAARGFKDGFDSEDMETIVDGISDTIVGIGAMSGSALGTVGGLAVATGLNLVAQPLFAEAEEKAAQFEQVYEDAYNNIAQYGRSAGEQVTLSGNIAKITSDSEQWNQVTADSNTLGLESATILRAWAGDADALAQVQSRANDLLGDASSKITDYTDQLNAGEITRAQYLEYTDEFEAAQSGLNGALDNATQKFETNGEAVDAAAAAVDALNQATGDANQEAQDHALALAASSGAAQDFAANIDGAIVMLRALPDGKVVKVTDDGTAELTQAEIDGIEGGSVSVQVNPDLDEADRRMQQWMARPRVVTISPMMGQRAV